MFLEINGKIHQVLNIVYLSTAFSELEIVQNRNAGTLIDGFVTLWIYKKGEVVALSEEDESNSKPFREALNVREIKSMPRSAR